MLARTFFKNRESTLTSYYTLNWIQREAVRLSWKCYQKFTLSDEEKKIVAVQEKLYERPPPTKTAVKAWFNKHLDHLKSSADVNSIDDGSDLAEWLQSPESNADLVDFILNGILSQI